MLRIEGLTKRYRTGDLALKGVDLAVPAGEVIGLIGPSGAGKSTLIRCINRLVEPTSGRIFLNEREVTGLGRRELRRMRRRMGMIFQEFALVERLTVMENVLSGRLGYVPFWQDPWASATVAVRVTDDARAVVPDLARIIRAMDPDLTMSAVMTMDHVVSDAMAADRFYSALLGAFAAVALVLASVGIYGVMSFVVSQRTHEIGLRMALGAGRGQVLAQVLREGMTTALAGTAVGAAGAFFVGRTMTGMVYGVEGANPLLFVAVALVLLGAAMVACLVPARRAASVDPMVALRQD
jgi:ABC-type Fe3+/spermidine/putrescine transport system ATPase subunit